MRTLLIVGGGLAGLRSAEAARELDPDVEITVVGMEPHRPYNRPPLSKDFLTGRTAAKDLMFDDSVPGVTWQTGSVAAHLDPRARTVTTAAGGVHHYDGHVIATGRSAVVPTWLPPARNVLVLRTLDDAKALRAFARPGARAGVVGGGFVGSEVAATLHGLGPGSAWSRLHPH